ncbi:MAG: response regulator [Azoarcus sp.]|jgi:two-component system response regulator DctR|nr:response regulator [Azoarcus sp.]
MHKAHAHIVEDDDDIRDALAWQFRTRDIESMTWANAEDFLAALQPDWLGCIVLDIRLSGMSGLTCFEQLLERGCHMPVIFITGHGDIPMAVSALKRGAFDFIEKPFRHNDLADRVQRAIAFDIERYQVGIDRDTIEQRLATLSAREREVMALILEGKYNKVIASKLSISMRTVEAHRAHIFSKMRIRSAVELAQLLTVLKD